MRNVQMTVEGTGLSITVELSKQFGPSASGKTVLHRLDGGECLRPCPEEKLGVNVYRKK